MRWLLRTSMLLFLLIGLAHPNAVAEEVSTTDNKTMIRSRVWSFSLTGKRHSWKSNQNNELLGNVAEVQIANGYLDRSWYVMASIDIILGPYAPSRGRQANLDYYGTGFTAWWGFSTQVGDLRSKDDGYGFALGLNYADIVGRNNSVGEKQLGNRTEKITSYQTRVASISLMPAIFFCWLNEGRPVGNKPELLSTRIEGYILLAGLALPIDARYQSRYEYTDSGGNHFTGREKGRFKGYSVFVSLQTLLGI